MRFARITFTIAGAWGIVVLTPLYFLLPAPSDYPQFFYGFLSLAMAWQVAFFIIGSNPTRFRPVMIAGMLEKFGYVVTVFVLYGLGRVSTVDAMTAVPDAVLGVLFIAAFARTADVGPI